MTLFNAVICIVSNISDFNDDQLTEIFLYGKEDFKNVNDTRILDVTINYLIETKIFNAKILVLQIIQDTLKMFFLLK